MNARRRQAVRRAMADRPGRRPRAFFDQESATWFIPMSDTWLCAIGDQWTEPVQLRMVTDDGGDSYRIDVRDAVQ